MLCGWCGYVSAQTQVVKINATKANDFGVRYMLPKTLLNVDVTFSETRQKAGTYAKYASRYLGLNDADVVLEDRTFFKLGNAVITETSTPNPEQTYLVTFKAKTTSPFVSLTEDGVLLAINAEYGKVEPPTAVQQAPPAAPTSDLPKINPQSIYTEEYLRAGSVGKMAEVAAKNIYKIRESRQDLLTGETENVPKDGEAMKIILANLDAQEKLWTELFTGSSETVEHAQSFVVEPTGEKQNEILFRFSNYLGIVAPDDLSGRPVTLTIIDLQSVEMPVIDPKKAAKAPQSIVYNVPGKAEVSLSDGSGKICSNLFNITQFGTTEILATSIFEDKKTLVRVYFYPTTGAIKQIDTL
ncbi:DUF4831 domain-containing protein [Bacteroidia bacterium]|nr:DUF4831 domain-containing protein [Bacteroidia bacterium]